MFIVKVEKSMAKIKIKALEIQIDHNDSYLSPSHKGSHIDAVQQRTRISFLTYNWKKLDGEKVSAHCKSHE